MEATNINEYPHAALTMGTHTQPDTHIATRNILLKVRERERERHCIVCQLHFRHGDNIATGQGGSGERELGGVATFWDPAQETAS